MADDSFELWLGRVGGDRPLAHRMRGAVNRAGGTTRAGGSRFTGARIGRGAGVGRVLASRGIGTGRRVVVKARIVRLGGKGAAAALAHLRYLQRDGTTRSGDRGALYGPGEAPIDGKAFLEKCAGDRHQFRFIVAPEDGAEYEDLKPLVRRWMDQVEQDLGTKLDWATVDHFNTGHPHAHVVVRGKADDGRDLVIARGYMTQGLRARAAEIVDLDLGPRSREEILRASQREVEQERLTSIDRRLLNAVGEDGMVRAAHADGVEQSLRAGRLQRLGAMGLATEERRGVWRLDPELADTLKRMGERGDIIRTMQRALARTAPGRMAADYAIHEPQAAPVVIGRVVERGLSDEHADRQYLVVDGIDGRYPDQTIGQSDAATPTNGLVRVTPASVSVRAADRTIAAVATAHAGTYSIDNHLRHDPAATEDFAQAHVRRLEAMRRTGSDVERHPDGTWRIAPDHLAKVEAWERARLQRSPVVIETLSSRPIEQLVRHDGVTWLDTELIATSPAPTGGGYGAAVRRSLDLRRQWLVEQELAIEEGNALRLRANLLATLQQRELRRVAGPISEELGKPFGEARPGAEISGVVRKAVQVGDAKFAVIEKSREFTLVPWRPVLERAIGKPVSGIMRDAGSISWTIGRDRGLGL